MLVVEMLVVEMLVVEMLVVEMLVVEMLVVEMLVVEPIFCRQSSSPRPLFLRGRAVAIALLNDKEC